MRRDFFFVMGAFVYAWDFNSDWCESGSHPGYDAFCKRGRSGGMETRWLTHVLPCIRVIAWVGVLRI